LQCEVTNEDSFEAALRLLRTMPPGEASALPPIVLNMANATWVGGGFLTGASGQEEELCRRSNLFPQLIEAAKEGAFPIPDLGAIVMPEVLVFRGNKSDGYPRLEEPYSVAAVTAAAPCRPDVSTADAKAAYVALMRAKVGALLSAVEHAGYSDVVLSAWGCGAFRNPPEEVARIFRDALGSQFKLSFRRIVFAIFDRPDWRESNCTVFQEALSDIGAVQTRGHELAP